MSAARDRWLDEGVAVLSEEGAAGVRIDRIAARLGLSKGSFHHHFDGATGFKRDLLAHVEGLLVDTVRTAISGRDNRATPGDVLAHLTDLVHDQRGLYRPELEVALRAWATWDADARQVQARIDRDRLDMLRDVWRPITADDDEARRAALLPYLIAVGATVLVPPVDAEDLHEVYRQILPLVPGRTVPG
jgi:AcrR family transcriptional regulator